MKRRHYTYTDLFGGSIVIFIFVAFLLPAKTMAFDADVSRQTLSGLSGFYVLIEDINPNIAKYAAVQRIHLDKEQIRQDMEQSLRNAGINVLTWNEMLKTTGKPILCITVNTHEYEKFSFAYDLKFEVQQMAGLEKDPRNKAMVSTWSINMTGVFNIGTINILRDSMQILVNRFITAYKLANPKK
jgi:hypothetical protein